MWRKFLRDERGNFAMLMALAMIPIVGALAIVIDYAQMSLQRQSTLNALDATNIAVAWRVLEGESPAEVLAYAQEFFEANLGSVKPENAKLNVVLPDQNTGGGTLKMTAEITYHTLFYPALTKLLNGDGPAALPITVSNEVRLKNTLEVALVLDNSGSMNDWGSGSGKRRIDLLKAAAKQLVDTLAAQAGMMKQVEKPVQFGLVPFAASVNVGPEMAGADWMDTQGRSPIHHENFDWTKMPSSLSVEKVGGVYTKTGSDWGAEQNQPVTRFSLFEQMRRKYCTRRRNNKGCQQYAEEALASWGGCVEMRPGTAAFDDTPPNRNAPETLFVPMFAPDEADNFDAYNSWWTDSGGSSAAEKQAHPLKYFQVAEVDAVGDGEGPNLSCTTKPITPLTDVTTDAGLASIKNAIDGMQAAGATNVPEGLAWGWRVVSNRSPFTDGRPDHQKGNDKVVIVLTDGANTYYTPSSLGSSDYAGNRSTYSNYGYAKNGRIFEGTSVSKTSYSNANYTRAMNEHMLKLCDNAKTGDIILMTVALDLSTSDRTEREQIEALKQCASYSRYRKDPLDPTRNAKLFWNATGANLAEKFKEIADELSNLRIVS